MLYYKKITCVSMWCCNFFLTNVRWIRNRKLISLSLRLQNKLLSTSPVPGDCVSSSIKKKKTKYYKNIQVIKNNFFCELYFFILYQICFYAYWGFVHHAVRLREMYTTFDHKNDTQKIKITFKKIKMCY